jgi:hypothetical protein
MMRTSTAPTGYRQKLHTMHQPGIGATARSKDLQKGWAAAQQK